MVFTYFGNNNDIKRMCHFRATDSSVDEIAYLVQTNKIDLKHVTGYKYNKILDVMLYNPLNYQFISGNLYHLVISWNHVNLYDDGNDGNNDDANIRHLPYISLFLNENEYVARWNILKLGDISSNTWNQIFPTQHLCIQKNTQDYRTHSNDRYDDNIMHAYQFGKLCYNATLNKHNTLHKHSTLDKPVINYVKTQHKTQDAQNDHVDVLSVCSDKEVPVVLNVNNNVDDVDDD